MSFVEDVQELRSKSDAIIEASKVLTPDVVKAVAHIGSIDIDMLEKIVIAAEKIQESRRDVLLVENGLSSIRRVVEMQNQVQFVSDARQNIGLVAGSLDSVNEVAEDIVYIRAVSAMKPMIDETLALSTKIDAVLDMEEDIKDFLKTAERMEMVLKEMNQSRIDVSKNLDETKEFVSLCQSSEMRVRRKEVEVEDMVRRLESFNVNVKHLDQDSTAYSRYSREANELEIGIPSGKVGEKGNFKGDKGEPGNNGSSFRPSYTGSRINRARYNSYPTGTSYLSLDEIPTMIYFRKSNAINDWTEGQPFGVSNGGYSDKDKGIDIVDGINIDELTTHILRNMKRRQDGNISTDSTGRL